MGIIRRRLEVDGYEQVWHFEDSARGLKSIIAIHNSNLGPACGGIRLLPYSSFEEGLSDVLKLAQGMSYKSALAGLNFGGGKSIVFADPQNKSEQLMHAFGECVDLLDGAYIAAKDMNIDGQDLKWVKAKTKHVLGVPGEPDSSGDPSPVTGRGIIRAMEATAEFLFGKRSLKGLKVAIQGIGHVGVAVARGVVDAGGEVLVYDVDSLAVKRAEKQWGAKALKENDLFSVECDFFSPCARGGILNADTISKLNCRAVVGCANNQLATPQDAVRLHERGVLYVPDFAINSGGIINIFVEHQGYSLEKALARADHIFDVTLEILRKAQEQNITCVEVAEKLAEEKMRAPR